MMTNDCRDEAWRINRKRMDQNCMEGAIRKKMLATNHDVLASRAEIAGEQ
jgi:hypothetical protein